MLQLRRPGSTSSRRCISNRCEALLVLCTLAGRWELAPQGRGGTNPPRPIVVALGACLIPHTGGPLVSRGFALAAPVQLRSARRPLQRSLRPRETRRRAGVPGVFAERWPSMPSSHEGAECLALDALLSAFREKDSTGQRVAGCCAAGRRRRSSFLYTIDTDARRLLCHVAPMGTSPMEEHFYIPPRYPTSRPPPPTEPARCAPDRQPLGIAAPDMGDAAAIPARIPSSSQQFQGCWRRCTVQYSTVWQYGRTANVRGRVAAQALYCTIVRGKLAGGLGTGAVCDDGTAADSAARCCGHRGIGRQALGPVRQSHQPYFLIDKTCNLRRHAAYFACSLWQCSVMRSAPSSA